MSRIGSTGARAFRVALTLCDRPAGRADRNQRSPAVESFYYQYPKRRVCLYHS
ncbi:hypothetical protein LARV_00501 [Longilinea arvoryzae]|uniref:Uncharacterized protein n=1 Tax=Longilinea arvoryzae TaxID=360412 RepID=A0A0S7BBX8_9CHLR|nr:hypothetical protein LARV_00501 [Longilinea arvoryzae]